MVTNQDPDERLVRAKARVEEIKGFYVHLLVYVAMNGVLFLLDVVSGGGYWFYWPALIWGMGLAAHAVALASDRLLGPDWEDRKIRKLMERDQRATSHS